MNHPLIVRPGNTAGIQVPLTHYLEIKQAVDDGQPSTDWLTAAARRAWSVGIAERPAS